MHLSALELMAADFVDNLSLLLLLEVVEKFLRGSSYAKSWKQPRDPHLNHSMKIFLAAHRKVYGSSASAGCVYEAEVLSEQH